MEYSGTVVHSRLSPIRLSFSNSHAMRIITFSSDSQEDFDSATAPPELSLLLEYLETHQSSISSSPPSSSSSLSSTSFRPWRSIAWLHSRAAFWGWRFNPISIFYITYGGDSGCGSSGQTNENENKNKGRNPVLIDQIYVMVTNTPEFGAETVIYPMPAISHRRSTRHPISRSHGSNGSSSSSMDQFPSPNLVEKRMFVSPFAPNPRTPQGERLHKHLSYTPYSYTYMLYTSYIDLYIYILYLHTHTI